MPLDQFSRTERIVRKFDVIYTIKTVKNVRCHWQSSAYEREGESVGIVALKTREIGRSPDGQFIRSGSVKNPASIKRAGLPRPVGSLPNTFQRSCRYQACCDSPRAPYGSSEVMRNVLVHCSAAEPSASVRPASDCEPAKTLHS